MSLFVDPQELSDEQIESEIEAATKLFDELILADGAPIEICEELVIYLDNLRFERKCREKEG